MNRDNLIFATFGLLVGFIAGYLMHEVMAARQPPRRLAGDVAAQMPGQVPGAAGEQGAPGAGMPGGGNPGLAMQEIQQLRDYVEANPNDAAAVLRLANLNFEIGQWARARDLYQRYVGLGNEDPNVLSDLGVTHRELGEYDRALELFRRAQRLDASHWQSVFNEVVVLTFDLKQYDAASQAMARLQQMQPGNADVTRLAAELDRLKSSAS